MTKALHSIREKLNSIQFGLLRFRNPKEEGCTLQVKAVAGLGYSFDCIVEDQLEEEMADQEVRLVQKHKDDYLYITGKVKAIVHKHKTILSVHIIRACWFVKHTKGTQSWFQEKHIYQQEAALKSAA